MVLSVGEVNKNKNHKVGIEALAKLNDPDVYYVICGRGPLMDAHKELAKELGVGDRAQPSAGAAGTDRRQRERRLTA